jgi:hypothetical protein
MGMIGFPAQSNHILLKFLDDSGILSMREASLELSTRRSSWKKKLPTNPTKITIKPMTLNHIKAMPRRSFQMIQGNI